MKSERAARAGSAGSLPPGVYVVIPAYAEGPAIAQQVRALRAWDVRVVVVDDGSPDDTGAQAYAAGAVVLRHVVNRGQGAALQTGISYALLDGAEYIVTFDADGQHPAEALPSLLAPLQSGEVEIVLGSRFLATSDADAVPPLRRLLLRAAVLFTRLTAGARVTDAHNGLRALTRKAARRIDIQLDRMAHASEIVDQIHASGLAYREVPVHIRYTDYSMLKGQHGSAAIRIAWDYLVAKLFR